MKSIDEANFAIMTARLKYCAVTVLHNYCDSCVINIRYNFKSIARYR